MEPSNSHRLHPLIAAAAIAVITVSAAGVAALTGVLPRSSASSAALSGTAPSTPAAPAAVAAQAGTDAAASPSASTSTPATAPETVTPAAKRRKPSVVRTRAPVETRRVEDPAVVRDHGPSAAPQALPPLAAAGNIGTVESVREIAQPGEGPGLGAIAGGVLGGVIGNQFGGGSGKKILTVAGAAGGAYAGHQVEKSARSTQVWNVSIRMDDGSDRTIALGSAPALAVGDKVRLEGNNIIRR